MARLGRTSERLDLGVLAGGPHCLDSPYQESGKGSRCGYWVSPGRLRSASCPQERGRRRATLPAGAVTRSCQGGQSTTEVHGGAGRGRRGVASAVLQRGQMGGHAGLMGGWYGRSG
jgi:hypothetical protein